MGLDCLPSQIALQHCLTAAKQWGCVSEIAHPYHMLRTETQYRP